MTIPIDETELQAIIKSARSLVAKSAVISGASSAAPIPGVDIAVDFVNMKTCLDKISKLFGFSPEQIAHLGDTEKNVLQGIISSSATSLVGKTITKELLMKILRTMGIKVAVKQVAKYVPIIGAFISGGIGYASFSYFGNRHIDDCEAVVREFWKKGGSDRKAA